MNKSGMASEMLVIYSSTALAVANQEKIAHLVAGIF